MLNISTLKFFFPTDYTFLTTALILAHWNDLLAQSQFLTMKLESYKNYLFVNVEYLNIVNVPVSEICVWQNFHFGLLKNFMTKSFISFNAINPLKVFICYILLHELWNFLFS